MEIVLYLEFKIQQCFDNSCFINLFHDRATGDDTRSLCTVVCKWTYMGHAHMQQMTSQNSLDTEACGWDDVFWQEIGLGNLVEGNYAKIGWF